MAARRPTKEEYVQIAKRINAGQNADGWQTRMKASISSIQDAFDRPLSHLEVLLETVSQNEQKIVSKMRDREDRVTIDVRLHDLMECTFEEASEIVKTESQNLKQFPNMQWLSSMYYQKRTDVHEVNHFTLYINFAPK